jgi:hypothetical protein
LNIEIISGYFQLLAKFYWTEFQKHKSLLLGKSKPNVNLARKFDRGKKYLSDKGLYLSLPPLVEMKLGRSYVQILK